MSQLLNLAVGVLMDSDRLGCEVLILISIFFPSLIYAMIFFIGFSCLVISETAMSFAIILYAMAFDFFEDPDQ